MASSRKRKAVNMSFVNDELLGLIPQDAMDALPERFKENVKRFRQGFDQFDSLPASQLTTEEVCTIFDLRIENEHEDLMPSETYDVPDDLVSMLKRWKSAIAEDQVENEAVARVRADVILLEAVLAERAEMQQTLETKPDPSLRFEIQSFRRDPHLYFETPFKMRVLYKGNSRELTGKADYSVGYLQGGSSSGNLICVEAKRRRDLGKAHGQVLAYMGIVHKARKTEAKNNAIVYGLATDSHDFCFLRIDNESRVIISPTFAWGIAELRPRIYSLIRTTIRAAVLSSPTTSPVKGEGSKAMFQVQSRSQYDFGAVAQFKDIFSYEDDSDTEFVNIEQQE